MGSRFLDCFAGSGSVGIEAISRGAESVAFIESSRRACEILRQNLESLDPGPSSRWRVVESTVQNGLKILQQVELKFDIVFLDPPYESASEYPLVLAALQQNEILDDEALIIAEHSKHVKLSPAVGDLTRTRQVRQGDSVLSIYQLT
jgi:16S rRNA (guanine966-N2)-methyltransferase